MYEVFALQNQEVDVIRSKLGSGDWQLKSDVVERVYQNAGKHITLRHSIAAALGTIQTPPTILGRFDNHGGRVVDGVGGSRTEYPFQATECFVEVVEVAQQEAQIQPKKDKKKKAAKAQSEAAAKTGAETLIPEEPPYPPEEFAVEEPPAFADYEIDDFSEI